MGNLSKVIYALGSGPRNSRLLGQTTSDTFGELRVFIARFCNR